MSKCAKCCAPLNKTTNIVDCRRCKKRFHLSCVNMQLHDLECLRDTGSKWCCPDCTKSERKEMLGDGRSASMMYIPYKMN